MQAITIAIKAISQLLSVFGVWGWVDLFAALLVAIGCAGEWWILFNKLPEHLETTGQRMHRFWQVLIWLENKIRPICIRLKLIRRPKISHFKETLLERLFVSIVALGVGIELIALPATLLEAAKVAEKASEAKERIAILEQTNATLFAIGERAKESAEVARKEAELAKSEREKAESGRLELEKQVLALTERAKSRSISPTGRSNVVAILNGVAKGHVEIAFFDKDPESIFFAQSLRRALTDANCDVSISPSAIFRAIEMFPQIIDLKPDLIFCVKDSKAPPLFANLLIQRLNADGTKSDGWPYNENLASDALQIWVIPKLREE